MDIKKFDIYRKVPKDLTQPTLSGALISIGCILFIVFLLMSEFLRFLSAEVQSELFVDDPDKSTKIPVELDISLPQMSCQYIGLDIQDEQGRHEVGHMEDAVKTPIGANGCRFQVKFSVNKVTICCSQCFCNGDTKWDTWKMLSRHQLELMDVDSKSNSVSIR